MRRLRERIQDSKSLGVPRREDSSLGTIEGLLERGVATGDQVINALCSQKVGGGSERASQVAEMQQGDGERGVGGGGTTVVCIRKAWWLIS